MRIAETTRTPPQHLIQSAAVSFGRQTSDVSHEERAQLLTKKSPSKSIETAHNTYSERAQLLPAPESSQHSWVA